MKGSLPLFAMAVLTCGAIPASGQDFSAEQRGVMGRLIAVGVVLSSADFIGGGSFDIDDASGGGEFRVRHFPITYHFGESDARMRPWILGAAGQIVEREAVEIIQGMPDRGRFEADSLAVAGGAEFDLGSGTYVEPRLALIYSQVEVELRYQSEESEAFRPILDGVFFNWEAKAVTLAAGVRLGYRKEFENRTAVDVAGEVEGLWTDPTETDSPVQDVSTSSDFTRLLARLRIPLGGTIRESQLYVVPRVAQTFFSRELSLPLDSDSMTQLNLRLVAEAPEAAPDASWWRRYGPRALGLSVTYTTADSFEGWSFGVTFRPWSSGW